MSIYSICTEYTVLAKSVRKEGKMDSRYILEVDHMTKTLTSKKKINLSVLKMNILEYLALMKLVKNILVVLKKIQLYLLYLV